MCAQQQMQAAALKQNSYKEEMNIAANNGCLEQIAVGADWVILEQCLIISCLQPYRQNPQIFPDFFFPLGKCVYLCL